MSHEAPSATQLDRPFIAAPPTASTPAPTTSPTAPSAVPPTEHAIATTGTLHAPLNSRLGTTRGAGFAGGSGASRPCACAAEGVITQMASAAITNVLRHMAEAHE